MVKLIFVGNPLWNVTKVIGCSQLVEPKICKGNRVLKKEKYTGNPRKTSNSQGRKLKAVCLENRKCTRKQMKIRMGQNMSQCLCQNCEKPEK